MSAEQPPRRGRPRDPDAESRIRARALDLLLDRGFDHVTVDDVADAAGVGKATIYRRWPSKEQLVYDTLTALFDVEVPDPDTGSFEEDTRQSCRYAVQFASTDQGRAMIRLAVTEATRDSAIARIYRDFLLARVDNYERRLQRARDRGEPIRGDVDAVIQVEWLTGLLVIRVVTGAPGPNPADVEQLVDLTMRSVRSVPAT